MAELDRSRVEAKIIETMEELVDDPALLNREARLEELDLGSLDVVEIAQVLEDEFDIEILGKGPAEGGSPEMKTVGEAVDALVARIERAGLLAVG
ncbi:MAG TPA: hypothetical protein VF715_06660 [Thermoleophilaceae bacterium]|jgi:acyl carrier protein